MSKVKGNSPKATRDVLKPYAAVFSVDSKPLKAKIIDSPIGKLVVVSNDTSILVINSVEGKHLDSELKSLTKQLAKPIIEDGCAKPLKSLDAELKAYFKGNLKEFKTSFEIGSRGTEFQRSVWDEIYKIQYGDTKTYSELAQLIGKPKSFRAVANACGKNPIAIVIPCHRVLASNNGLGGYSSGIEKKEWLLALEE